MKSLDGGSDKFEFDNKCDKSITQQLNTNKTHCAAVTTVARVVDMSFYDFTKSQQAFGFWLKWSFFIEAGLDGSG